MPTLNIGLWRNDDGPQMVIDPKDILAWLRSKGVRIAACRVAIALNGEPTLAIRTAPGLIAKTAYRLAETFGQDAVAVWWPTTAWGELVGPRAADWGPFDRSRFIDA